MRKRDAFVQPDGFKHDDLLRIAISKRDAYRAAHKHDDVARIEREALTLASLLCISDDA